MDVHATTVLECQVWTTMCFWTACPESWGQMRALLAFLGWHWLLFPPSSSEPTLFRNFVPLRNFLPGRQEYDNTCFIASALNLSAWIPAIAQGMGIQPSDETNWNEQRWQDVILNTRSKWQGKYQWTQESHGQDDVAELVGDILYDFAGTRDFDVASVRQLRTWCIPCVREHSWDSDPIQEMMAVLLIVMIHFIKQMLLAPLCHLT